MVRSAASTATAVASIARSATLWDVATKLANVRFIVWDQTRSGTIATVPVAVERPVGACTCNFDVPGSR